MDSHTTIHSLSLRYDVTTPDHPLNKLLQNPAPPRIMKKSIFNSPDNLILLHTTHHNIDHLTHKTHSGSAATPTDYPWQPYPWQTLTRHWQERGWTAQRRLVLIWADKSPFRLSYLHRIDPTNNPSPNFPLFKTAEQNTSQPFNCPCLWTASDPDCLWSSPVEAAVLLDHRTAALRGGPVNLLPQKQRWWRSNSQGMEKFNCPPHP